MTKEELINGLNKLNERLCIDNLRGEIYLYGGAVMCLCLDARDTTKDIDAVFRPKNKIYEYAEIIANEYGYDKDWINDSVKGFLSDNNSVELFDSLSNLDIYNASYDYLFAMKCMSCRLEITSHDIDDIKTLIKTLNILSVDEALSIIEKYFPKSLILPKTEFMLMELFLQ